MGKINKYFLEFNPIRSQTNNKIKPKLN